jgi:hypothetical protein
MTSFSKDEAEAIKDWYNEWGKIPTYLATISFALLAFSFSQLLPASKTSSNYLTGAWIVLIASAAFSFISIVTAYAAFDLASRIHLSELIANLGMDVPRPNTPWVRRLGKVSFAAAIVSTLLILAGICLLAVHVFANISIK